MMPKPITDKQRLLEHLNGILPGCVFELIRADEYLQFQGQGFALPWFACISAHELSVLPSNDRYCIQLTNQNIKQIQTQFLSLQFTNDKTISIQLDYLKINSGCYDIKFEQLLGQYVYDDRISIHMVRDWVRRLEWLLLNRAENIEVVLPRLFYFFIHVIYFLPPNQNWSALQDQIYKELLVLVNIFRKSNLFSKMIENDRLLFSRIEAQLYMLEVRSEKETDDSAVGKALIKIAQDMRPTVTVSRDISCSVALLCNVQYEIDKNICLNLITDLFLIIELFKNFETVYNKELISCDFAFLVDVLMRVYGKVGKLYTQSKERLMPALIDYFEDLPGIILSLHEKGIEALRVAQQILPLLIAPSFYQPGCEYYDDSLTQLVTLLCQNDYITIASQQQLSLGVSLKFEQANFLHMLISTASYDLVEKIFPVLHQYKVIFELIQQPVQAIVRNKRLEGMSFAIFLEHLLNRYPYEGELCVASLLQVLMLNKLCHPKLMEILIHLAECKKLTQNIVSGYEGAIIEMAVDDGLTLFIELLMDTVRFDDDRLIDLLKGVIEYQDDRTAIAQMVFDALVRNLKPELLEVQLDMPKELAVYLHRHYPNHWPFSYYVHAKTGALMTAEMLLAHQEIQKLQAINIEVTLDLRACCYVLVCQDYKQPQQILIKQQKQPVAYTPCTRDIKRMLLMRYEEIVDHKAYVCVSIGSILYNRHNSDDLLSLAYQQTSDYQQLECLCEHLELLLARLSHDEIDKEILSPYRDRLEKNQEQLISALTEALAHPESINGVAIKELESKINNWQRHCASTLEKVHTAIKRQQDKAQRCLQCLTQRLSDIRSQGYHLDKQQVDMVSAAQKLVRKLSKKGSISVECMQTLEQKNRELADIQRILLRQEQNRQREVAAKALLVLQQKQRALGARRRTKSEETLPAATNSPPEVRPCRTLSEPVTVPVADTAPVVTNVAQEVLVNAPNLVLVPQARSTCNQTSLFGSYLNVGRDEAKRLDMESSDFDVVRSVLLAL